MKKSGIGVILTLLIIFAFSQAIFAQESDEAVVQVILFYSPTCPHCHDVIEIHMPKIKETYGSQLQVVGIDTSHQTGSKLYEGTVEAMDIPRERLGVPALVIGDVVLVGSQEIPEQLPGLIDEGLANGGQSWPAIPGLTDAVPNLPPPAGSQADITTPTNNSEVTDEIITEGLSSDSEVQAEDPMSFILGWIVFVGMIAVLIYAVIKIWRNPVHSSSDPSFIKRWLGWSIPILSLAGIGIAGYLAYVEISQVEAVCGPVGECNVVQSSEYAQIFGIPVAVFGLLFYLAILGAWLLIRFVKADWIKWMPTLIFVLTIVGTLFSIYLTALELLVIHAICAWCLSSAVVTTILLLITVLKLTQTEIQPTEG